MHSYDSDPRAGKPGGSAEQGEDRVRAINRERQSEEQRTDHQREHEPERDEGRALAVFPLGARNQIGGCLAVDGSPPRWGWTAGSQVINARPPPYRIVHARLSSLGIPPDSPNP